MEEDKKKHALVMFFITLGVSLYTKNVFLAVIIALIIALSKEVYDMFWGTGYSIMDMSANSIGIFSAFLLFFIITEYIDNKDNEL